MMSSKWHAYLRGKNSGSGLIDMSHDLCLACAERPRPYMVYTTASRAYSIRCSTCGVELERIDNSDDAMKALRQYEGDV